METNSKTSRNIFLNALFMLRYDEFCGIFSNISLLLRSNNAGTIEISAGSVLCELSYCTEKELLP